MQHNMIKDFPVVTVCREDVAERVYRFRDGMSKSEAYAKAGEITGEQMEALAETLAELYFEYPNSDPYSVRLIEAYDTNKEQGLIP